MLPSDVEQMPHPSWLPDSAEHLVRQDALDEEPTGTISVLLSCMFSNYAQMRNNKKLESVVLEMHQLFRKYLFSGCAERYPAFDIVQCWTESENGIMVSGSDITEEQSQDITGEVETMIAMTSDFCIMEMNNGLN